MHAFKSSTFFEFSCHELELDTIEIMCIQVKKKRIHSVLLLVKQKAFGCLTAIVVVEKTPTLYLSSFAWARVTLARVQLLQKTSINNVCCAIAAKRSPNMNIKSKCAYVCTVLFGIRFIYANHS